jgi:hypothetical protein
MKVIHTPRCLNKIRKTSQTMQMTEPSETEAEYELEKFINKHYGLEEHESMMGRYPTDEPISAPTIEEMLEVAENYLPRHVDAMHFVRNYIRKHNIKPRKTHFDPYDDATGQDLDLAHNPYQETDSLRPEF